MRTRIGVFFGGRSVEHEISVISALQAIAALDPARYEVIPVYITKQGRWFTGKELLESTNYRDMTALEKRTTEVYMEPVYGSRNLYKKGGCMGRRKVASTLDVALPVLHGTTGEDGSFQGFLELTGIPYVGCNPLSSALGMDKIAMKMVLAQSGIPVIDYVWFTDRQWHSEQNALISRIENEIGYPVIVKPANLGSSVGISRVRDREELLKAVGEGIGYSSRIIVERMIEPLREINCSVLGSADDHRTSVCEEPVRSGEILSYADKYLSGGSGKWGAKTSAGGAKNPAGDPANKSVSTGGATTNSGEVTTNAGGAKTSAGAGMASVKRRLPADLTSETTAEIRRLASETFRVLGCEGVARIDFILDGAKKGGKGASLGSEGTIYVNEINTIPGSLSFYLWEATPEAATSDTATHPAKGLPFERLMDALIKQALKRERDKGHKIVSYDQNIFSMGSFAGTGGKTGGKSGLKGAKFSGKK